MLNLDTLEVIGYFIDNADDLENYNKNFNFMSLDKKLHKMRLDKILDKIEIFNQYKTTFVNEPFWSDKKYEIKFQACFRFFIYYESKKI
jgi:hypothetical protein